MKGTFPDVRLDFEEFTTNFAPEPVPLILNGRLLAFIWAHWKVKNHLHWRRDAILGEDRCRVRSIPVMEMLAVLNTVVLSLMNIHHISTVARQLRHFSAHPEEAFPWLLLDF